MIFTDLKSTNDFQKQLSQFIVKKEVIVNKLDLKFYRNLDEETGSFWTYLYMTGYFNAKQISETQFTLSFPNKEVRELFMSSLVQWQWNSY